MGKALQNKMFLCQIINFCHFNAFTQKHFLSVQQENTSKQKGEVTPIK